MTPFIEKCSVCGANTQYSIKNELADEFAPSIPFCPHHLAEKLINALREDFMKTLEPHYAKMNDINAIEIDNNASGASVFDVDREVNIYSSNATHDITIKRTSVVSVLALDTITKTPVIHFVCIVKKHETNQYVTAIFKATTIGGLFGGIRSAMNHCLEHVK